MVATTVRNAVVVGAGAMGSGIAAHLANGGAHVRLLDVVAEGESGTAPDWPGTRLHGR